jgi:hypothetical protein
MGLRLGVGMAKIRRTAKKSVAPPHVVNNRIQKRIIARLTTELEEIRRYSDTLEQKVRVLEEKLARAREVLRGGFEALEDTRPTYPLLSDDSVNKVEDEDETEEEDPSESPAE